MKKIPFWSPPCINLGSSVALYITIIQVLSLCLVQFCHGRTQLCYLICLHFQNRRVHFRSCMFHEYVQQRRAVLLQSLWTTPTEYGGLVAEHHPHPQLVDVMPSPSCQLHSSISVNIQLDYSRLMVKFIVAIWKVSSLFTIFCIYWFSTSKLSSKEVE